MPVFQELWSRDQWTALPVYRSILTPLSFLERTLHVFPEKIGVVDGNRQFTYAQFGERVYRLASALRSRGIEKGDRVAILCRNSGEMLEAHFAVPQLGAILVPINTRLSADEVSYILDHCGSRALICDVDLLPIVENTPELARMDPFLVVDLRARHSECDSATAWPANAINYEALLLEGTGEPFNYAVDDEEQVISINYTSGTTGRPKGVMYTHRGAYLNALGEIIVAGLSAESAYLWTLPMFHCNGWCYPWAVTGAGATHLPLHKVEPDRIFDLIESRGVTHFCGAPTVLIMLASNRPDYRLPRLVTIVTAAAPPPPAIIEKMEAMGARLIHVYGLTETYGPHTLCQWKVEWDRLPAPERARMKSRQGVGFIQAPEVRVVDANMRDVAADAETMGEVVMRGNNAMKGYYQNPEATAEAFRGGWFHSGDLGVMHPDGYIELRDRAKDIIISGGENISTIEVEQALYRHPAVLEAVVIGIPDDKWGEVPKAFIVLKPDAVATAEEIIHATRQRLAHFKCPRHVEFIDALPKTSTGKVQKYVLRDQEWQGRTRRIN